MFTELDSGIQYYLGAGIKTPWVFDRKNYYLGAINSSYGTYKFISPTCTINIPVIRVTTSTSTTSTSTSTTSTSTSTTSTSTSTTSTTTAPPTSTSTSTTSTSTSTTSTSTSTTSTTTAEPTTTSTSTSTTSTTTAEPTTTSTSTTSTTTAEPTTTTTTTLPTSTIFLTDLTGYLTDTEACSNGIPGTNRYISGAVAAPEIGQFVYTNNTLTSIYDGNNEWHKMSYSEQAWAVNIGIDGAISGVTPCP